MNRSAGVLWGAGLVLMLLSGYRLGAQASPVPQALGPGPGPTATITFVQGGDLSVIRGGAPLALDDPLGFKLIEGDQVQTGAKTQVELLLMPRDARVRLAENSVLTIAKLEQSGASGLSLVYGRLRSKVAVLASVAPDFSVTAGVVSAGVRGTDFGCDLVVPRSGSLATAPVLVYCFEGTVAVSPAASTPASPQAPAPVLVTAGTMATVEVSAAGATPSITTQAIAPEIQRFWSANDFAPTAASVAGAPAAQVAASVLPADELAAYKKLNAKKNAVIAGGLVFAALGAALEGGALYYRSSNANLADTLVVGGLVCAATAVPTLFVAIGIDPFEPRR